MSDKEDRKSARKTLKTAKKGSAAYKEARGILSGDSPEEREYRKTTGKNKNRTNPYKDIIGSTGYVMGKFPETMMDIEDGIGFGKLYEGEMKGRGKKSLEKTDEDYSGDRPTKKKMGGGYMKKNMKVGGSLEMVKKNGKEVPFYAADGVGKMAKGGKVSKAMGGGKVYKYGHGGGLGKTKVKRISKNETNGNKIVDDCYKNYV